MSLVSRLDIPKGTVAERSALGKEARKRVPRSSHASFQVSAERRSPLDVLEEQARTRVPELLPIRYGRMASSPFAFFRGAAAVMAMDLATTPASGLRVQVCGDAHLVNFGIYNSPERRLMFDLNDFDETLPGPWEWDVKRLAASLVVACQDNGFDEASTIDVVRDAVRSYRSSMTSFAAMTNLQVWYSRLEVENLLTMIGTGAVASTATSTTSTCVSCATARAASTSRRWSRRACASTPRPARGRWPGRTPGRAPGSRSPPTSATAERSTTPLPSSPSSTPRRTVATTPSSSRRSRPVASRPSTACDASVTSLSKSRRRTPSAS